MANIRPFGAIRPSIDKAASIASLPYDTFETEEARAYLATRPDSFLRIDRPETQFEDGHDIYADDVYRLAGENLWKAVERGDFIRDEAPHYYVYELTMGSRTQTGLVACVSIDDYLDNTVKKHENTRMAKEKDRIRHVEACHAQTGPVFLAYRKQEAISRIIASVKQTAPIYDFTAQDHVKQRVWMVLEEKDAERITGAFEFVDKIYIADGHNRAAAAVEVGQKLRETNPEHNGTEEYNYVLSVLFPDEDLYIMEYNRILKDLNGLTPAEFLQRVSSVFHVTPVTSQEKYPQKKVPLPCIWMADGMNA